MNNYLSYRWPSGAPKAPLQQRKPGESKSRRPRRLLPLLGGVALAILLLTASGLTLPLLADHLLTGQQTQRPVPSERPSRSSQSTVAWKPEDLPWGQASQTFQLSMSPNGQALDGAEIYETVLPSTVGITASSDMGYGMGTGIIASADGYIVTNYHVIEGSTSIQVVLLSSSASYPAAVIGFDEEKDLAVLKIDAQNLTPAVFGSSDLLSVGDPVYAIGNPMGYLYGSMTDGIVSALARPQDMDGYTMYLIQTSAPLNSGNSGGALVNRYGQVVGITVAKISDVSSETIIEGLGLAIPISDALPYLNHILRTGVSCRPSIGILCHETQSDGVQGIYVQEITKGSPAVGILQPQDIILSANGMDTPDLYCLSRALGNTGVGEVMELSILRDGRRLSLSVTLYDSLSQ